jgi:hypothetical protein
MDFMIRVRRGLLGLLLWAVLTSPAPAAPALVEHDITLTLDPESGRIEAIDRVRGAWSGSVAFELAPGLTVRRAEADGRRAVVAGGSGQWRLDLGERAVPEITIEYEGALAPPADATGDLGAVGAEGAFLPASAGWFPLMESDAIGYRLAVEVPAPHRAVATGRLVDEQEADGAYRAVFVSEQPFEGPTLFAGPYKVSERRHGELRLRTYFHADLAPLTEEYLDIAARHLDLYAARIGPYPYAGFAMISAPLPVGLGFPGLTYMARRILHLPFIKALSLPHEILHNWWGNGVFVAAGAGNWFEGLTTYMADYARTEARDPAAARELRLAWLRDYAALPAERDRPLTAFQGRAHDADQVVGYNKAAFVFHMLRRELGDAGFEAGVRRLWTDHRLKTASWDDLRRSFESASGRDLRGFFGQWLSRPGAPRLRLLDAAAQATGDGFEVAIDLAQDAPVYALSVPVLIETAAGPERHRVALHGASAAVNLRTRAKPSLVALDPDYELFRRLAPGEAPPILRDVTLDPAAVAVLTDGVAGEDAARTLVGRLLEGRLPIVPAGAAVRAEGPILAIGLTAELPPLLGALGLGPVPETLARRGTLRAWTARRGDGRVVFVVAADEVAALRAVLRPLPHYRGMSFLVFEGIEATAKGVWPGGDSPLRRRLP